MNKCNNCLKCFKGFESEVYSLCKPCFDFYVKTKIDDSNIEKSIKAHCYKLKQALLKKG